MKTRWHDWLLLSSSLQCNHQATALKTSSGKGDLQCSATNAGDWVCIVLLFPNSEKAWSAFVVLFPFWMEWSPKQLIITQSSSDHQVIIPGIGRRCRYAWPATGSSSSNIILTQMLQKYKPRHRFTINLGSSAYTHGLWSVISDHHLIIILFSPSTNDHLILWFSSPTSDHLVFTINHRSSYDHHLIFAIKIWSLMTQLRRRLSDHLGWLSTRTTQRWKSSSFSDVDNNVIILMLACMQ